METSMGSEIAGNWLDAFYTSYKGWKHSIMCCCVNRVLLFILPIRDGNFHPRCVLDSGIELFILPIRDGNLNCSIC